MTTTFATPLSSAEPIAWAMQTASPAPALSLLDGSSVRCGFPSPAQDCALRPFNLMEHIAPRPVSTFMLRVRGDSMQDAGIRDGGLIVVDRSLQAGHGDMVVAVVDGEFTVKQLYLRDGRCELHPANEAYPTISIPPESTLEIWGVVTAAVTSFLKHPSRGRAAPPT
jgi:DNA polymerase V